MPSLEELIKLFSSGILSSPHEEVYWSSSEYPDSNDAAYTYAGDGIGIGYEYKENKCYFIPVRYFEITLDAVIAKSDSGEKVVVPVRVRNHEMTCYQVWINESNNFEFVFWWEYANNNWVKIYDMTGNEVFSIDMKYGNARFEAELFDGMYTVKTFHNGFERLIQEFLIGKP